MGSKKPVSVFFDVEKFFVCIMIMLVPHSGRRLGPDLLKSSTFALVSSICDDN